MSEEKEKPVTITIKITMPTKEVIASAIQKLFPFSNLYDFKVAIEEEKPSTAPASSVGSGRPMTDPSGVPPQASPEEVVVNYKSVNLPLAYSGQGETIKVEPEEEKKPEEAPPAKPEG